MSEDTKNGLAVQAQGLVKRYNDEVLAVDGVDLTIRENTIYALLGPNGAGKTTMISMLTTLIEPTDGTASVVGYDVGRQADQVRERIGVTFQEMVLDDELTGRQVLDYHGRFYGMGKSERQERISDLLALVELEEAADRVVRTYSGGMKRRLELARSLMTNPEMLFLDEPTLGLDPQTRGRVWDYICGQGDEDLFIQEVKALPYVQVVTTGDEGIQIGVGSGNRRLVGIVTLANENHYQIEDIAVNKPSLGEAFFQFTGRRLRDE